MATFALKTQRVEEVLDFSVIKSEHEDLSEQRALTSRKKIISFKLESPAATKSDMQAYRQHLLDHWGNLTAFDYVSPFDDLTYSCRLEGGMRSDLVNGHYKVKFSFKVINQVSS